MRTPDDVGLRGYLHVPARSNLGPAVDGTIVVVIRPMMRLLVLAGVVRADEVGLFHVVACVVGLVACGSVRPSVVGSEDGGVDSTPVDGQNGDAAPPLPTSCVGLPNTCGISGDDSCCSSFEVVGGMYYRSYDLANDSSSGNMSYPAAISNFRLDKYEVTVERFRAFVADGMGTRANHPVVGAGAHANIPQSGWEAGWNASLVADTAALVAAVKCDSTLQSWTDTPGANEHRPMACITWYEAMAFCAWDGGYLPTEAEWNYAAAGGNQQRVYPWSSPAASLIPLDGDHASYSNGTDCVGDGMPGCAVTDLVTVGTKPKGDGRWGQSDLAGNVWEWTLDWLAPYASACTDCADLTAASVRVVRGGGFGSFSVNLRSGSRGMYAPVDRSNHIGVRCARALYY